MSLHTVSTFQAEAMRIGLIVGAITAAFMGIALLRSRNPAQGLDTLLIATTFVAGGLWWKHFHFIFHTWWIDPHSMQSHALLIGLLLSMVSVGALVALSGLAALDTGRGGVAMSILTVSLVIALWWWQYHYVLRTLWDR